MTAVGRAAVDADVFGLAAHFDGEVQLGLRKRARVQVDTLGVRWNGSLFPYGDCSGVAYLSRRCTVNFFQSGIERLVRLEVNGEVHDLDLGKSVGGQRDETANAYAAIVAGVTENLEPRLRKRMLGRIADDEVVAVSALRISTAGIDLAHSDPHQRRIDWAELPSAAISAATTWNFGRVLVNDAGSSPRGTCQRLMRCCCLSCSMRSSGSTPPSQAADHERGLRPAGKK